MDSSTNEITHDFPPFFRVYKDGRIERYVPQTFAPPTVDPTTGVESKDAVISSGTDIKARIFIPKVDGSDQKLPLLVHYHGGGFCCGSALGDLNQKFINSLVNEANVVAVSVDYRLAPENPLPIAFDDSWVGFQWIASHLNGQGPEPWINKYADFGRVFIMGESAGATIASHVAIRAGRLDDPKLRGLMIVHPYFATGDADKMVQYMYPTSSGSEDDPKLNPAADPDWAKMKCSRVFVCVAENDSLKPGGVAYNEALKKSGWDGTVDFVENEGQDHCYHMLKPNTEETLAQIQRFARFIKSQD